MNPATGKFDPENPAIVADATQPRRPEDRLRPDPRRPQGAPRRRRPALHRHVLRQRPPQRPGLPRRRRRARRRRRTPPSPPGCATPSPSRTRWSTASPRRPPTASAQITRDEFGIEDAWPVFCEDFLQWVVEDDFPAGRPAFEEVGAEFVADVTPYEMMKLRILNAGHAIIAYPSGLLDIHFVHEGMENPLVRAFLQKVERDEIIPIVPPVPNTDLDGYFRKVEERCLNPKIGDTIRRLCLDGSNRQPKFIIPSIADRLAKGPAGRRPRARVRPLGALLRRHHRLRRGRSSRTTQLGPADRAGRAPPRRPRRLARDARHLRRHRRRAGLRATPSPALAPRPLGRRHRGDAPPLPRMSADRRPRRASSSSTATACSSTASRSRCACSLETLAGPASTLDPGGRTRAFSAARSPRPARSSPREYGVTVTDAALDDMRRPALRRLPRRARRRSRTSPRPSTRCPAPTASPPRRSPSASSCRSPSPGSGRASPAAAFSATMVANGKPAPDLFLFAAETLGYPPAACLVVEDSPAGIRRRRPPA